MSAKILLRISSFFLLIHLLGHGVGHFTWDKPEDPQMRNVVDVMKSYSAAFMGATRSMADYYNGFSLMAFGFLGLCMLILWFASGINTEKEAFAKKVIYSVGITLLFFGVIEWFCFFPFAAGMSFFAGLLAVVSLQIRKK